MDAKHHATLLINIAMRLNLQLVRFLVWAGLLAGTEIFNLGVASAETATGEGSAVKARPGLNVAGTVLNRAGSVPATYKTFAEWKAACDRLPLNRQLRRALPAKDLLPLKTYKEFDEVLEGLFAECKKGVLSMTNAWVGTPPSRGAFFNTDRVYFQKAIPFQPFAQKLVVPAGAEVLFHGDLHGDVHSLIAWLEWLNENRYLDGWTLARANTYIVMLGDYTDRGMYGVEVLYTLLRLKLANPDRVCLIRGNHEDVTLAMNYGFLAEIQGKYGREFNVTKVLRAYDFLPVVLYLGSGGNFIQCNHGGMEPGYDPSSLLNGEGSLAFQFIGRLSQLRFLKDHPNWIAQMDPRSKVIAGEYLRDFRPENPVTPSTLGFMWNDFTVAPGEPALSYDPGRAFVYGENATQYILNAAGGTNGKVQAVFRAHQHSSVPNPLMRRLKVSRGLFRHWQPQDSTTLLAAAEPKLQKVLDQSAERPIPPGSVWTFNVAPDTVYGEGCEFDFDTSAILKVGDQFEDWRLKVVNVRVVK